MRDRARKSGLRHVALVILALSLTAFSGHAWAGLKPGPSGSFAHRTERPDFSPAGTQDAPAQDASARATTAERPSFDDWLDGVRRDALARGIRAGTIDRAFKGLRPLDIVVKRDRSQAEFTQSLDGYLSRRLAGSFVRDVRAAYTKHRSLLRRVGDRYGVPPATIAAVWALESNLGRFSGVRPTIATLATLGWEGRREAFFRAELIAALTIVDRGDIELERLKGSWAGALGQPQFMPTSYLRYAQDFDGDGRRDIWRTPADVFASIAYYLSENGWKSGQAWGREVRIPDAARASITNAAPLRTEGCRAEREMTVARPLLEWHDWGVRRADGRPLPTADIEAALLDAPPRAFLLYPNYGALLDYNCAHAYALAVGLLADRLEQPPGKDERPAVRRRTKTRAPRKKSGAPRRR
jgi:membrane-bound lytic murein transglycosylase B